MAPCHGLQEQDVPSKVEGGRGPDHETRSQGPLSSALLCSSFPPSLFSNDVIYSIIYHLTAIVDESNPLNLPWEQPQGRRQVSRKYIKENADRQLRQGTGGRIARCSVQAIFHQLGLDSQCTGTGKACDTNSLSHTLPGSSRRVLMWQLFQPKSHKIEWENCLYKSS